MTETEQLRKELNELRERVAVLESQRNPPPAPVAPGRPGGAPLFPAGGGLLGEAARRQQEEAARHRDRHLRDWNVPQQTTLGSGVMAQGLSSDRRYGLVAGYMNAMMPCEADYPVVNRAASHPVAAQGDQQA